MTVSPQSQYREIQQALEKGEPLAFDKQENRFKVLSADISSSSASTAFDSRYITDLGALKDKIVEFIKENGIGETQLKELTQAFESAAKRLESSSSTESQNKVSQLKEFSKAITKASEQAKKIPSQIPATPGKGVKEAVVSSQRQINEALAVKIKMDDKLPVSLKQMVESFETERNFYTQNTHLNSLFRDPDFINILKDKSIGNESLDVMEIATLGNFQPVIRETEKMLLGFYSIYQKIQQESYKEATQEYVQLIADHYGSYADALAERTQAYTTFTNHEKKLKAAENAFRKNHPAKYKKIFSDRLSIMDKAITSVQRSPRHDMFADAIARKTPMELRVEGLSDTSPLIKYATKKINQAQDEFENANTAREFENSLLYTVEKKEGETVKKVRDDPEWKSSLAKFGLDRAALNRVSGWYDAFGKTVAELKLPILALEEDPNNIELQKAVQPSLTKLKKELQKANIKLDEPQAWGLDQLSNAIQDYNENQPAEKALPDFGALMSERLALVTDWIGKYA